MLLRTILVLGIVLLGHRDASACSCVNRTFAEHAKSAKHVLLARAGKPVKTGDALKQTFAVLAVLKGPAQTQFVFDRPATPPCAASYADGELAILFTGGGELDPCHGNVPLETQVREFSAILTATGGKRDAAKPEALEAALRAVLPKYLHDRPQVAIRHAPLAGTAFEIGKSHLAYAKTANPKDIEIIAAFATGPIAFVDGKYATEGIRFTVLLQLETTWKILGSWTSER